MTLRTLTLTILSAAALLTAGADRAEAQTDHGTRTATTMLSVGLGFAGGASISLEAPENWKIAPIFSYRTGLDATYPITSVFGASLGVGLDSRGTKQYWHDSKDIWEVRKVSYLSITPGFRISSFFLGLNIGVPMSAYRIFQNGPDAAERTVELDPTKDSLLLMLEPRIGAVIPIVDEEIGWLGLTIGVGYNLNDISERDNFMPYAELGSAPKTQTVSAHLGLTWQFGIPGTHRE